MWQSVGLSLLSQLLLAFLTPDDGQFFPTEILCCVEELNRRHSQLLDQPQLYLFKVCLVSPLLTLILRKIQLIYSLCFSSGFRQVRVFELSYPTWRQKTNKQNTKNNNNWSGVGKGPHIPFNGERNNLPPPSASSKERPIFTLGATLLSTSRLLDTPLNRIRLKLFKRFCCR